jgi:GNAT superfamily N-acetyltransferase
MKNNGIRPARQADIAIIHTLICELAAFENLSHEVVASEADLHQALFSSSPVAEALVAEVNGEIAGFAVFFTTYSTFAGKPGLFLEDLYVRPSFRAKGLGKSLIVAGAKIAHHRGYARYEWVVLDWNSRAISFYESCGAKMHAAWRRMRVSNEDIARLAGAESIGV